MVFKKVLFGKQKLYRLSDCYIRFHLKYVEPYQELFGKANIKKTSKGKLPGWDAIMGFNLRACFCATANSYSSHWESMTIHH